MRKSDLERVLVEEERKHAKDLNGLSGKSEEYERGFVAGLKYVREHLLPPLVEAGSMVVLKNGSLWPRGMKKAGVNEMPEEQRPPLPPPQPLKVNFGRKMDGNCER